MCVCVCVRVCVKAESFSEGIQCKLILVVGKVAYRNLPSTHEYSSGVQ